MTEIDVLVRVLPGNDEVDVTLPVNATASDVIETLLDNGIAERMDASGNMISYKLVAKGKNETIDEEETLEAARIQKGDILLMTPILVAGN